jgi:Rrf2 family protein
VLVLTSSLYGAGAEYALHSLLVLASTEAPLSVADLATYQHIPERFLAKVFSRLKQAGLVTGIEGIAGGFVLARPADSIRVLDVLDAVDAGRRVFTCAEIRRGYAVFEGTPPSWATHGPCRIHHFMTEAEEALRGFLATRTIADLAGEPADKAPASFHAQSTAWFGERRAGRTVRGARRPAAQS